MKQYLNRETRETMLTAMVVVTRINELVKTQAVTPEEKRLLRTAATNLQKASDQMVRRVGPDGAKQFLRMVDTTRLVWMDNPAARAKLNEPEQYHFTSDDLDPVLAVLMTPCKQCQGEAVCATRTFFERVLAPEYNDGHPRCPYAHKEAE